MFGAFTRAANRAGQRRWPDRKPKYVSSVACNCSEKKTQELTVIDEICGGIQSLNSNCNYKEHNIYIQPITAC